MVDRLGLTALWVVLAWGVWAASSRRVLTDLSVLVFASNQD